MKKPQPIERMEKSNHSLLGFATEQDARAFASALPDPQRWSPYGGSVERQRGLWWVRLP
jgi:hypothetical protein